MNILWLSANTFGRDLLSAALSLRGIHVSAIVTLSQDSETKMYDGVSRDTWNAFNIPVIEVSRIDDAFSEIVSLHPDLIVMAGWRQILPKKILAAAKSGVVGFHPTLLPKGRGPAPIINSILEGYTNSGVTMFYVNDGTDTGDIIGQEAFVINEQDYSFDVYKKMTEAGTRLIRRFLPMLAEGNAPRIPQDDSQATYFPKRTLADNELLPSDSEEMRRRKVRAFAKPYAGAFTMEAGVKKIVHDLSELNV